MTMMCKIIVILNLRLRVDYENQDTIDGPDVSLSKSKLILEQENDPELTPLFKLVLLPVELDKVPVGYYVRNYVLMKSGGHQMSLHLKNGQ